jgi:hypothetical protein
VDKLVLVDTHANPDAQRDNLALDISLYAADNIPDADTKTDFSKMELFIELKFAETSDTFRDPKDPRQPQAGSFRFENVLSCLLRRRVYRSSSFGHSNIVRRISLMYNCEEVSRFGNQTVYTADDSLPGDLLSL